MPPADLSAAGSEKGARNEPHSAAPKPRSCVVCRSRKVRCDKLSPCSNCRRANIPCVLPSADRPPRWARRLDRANLAASSSNAQQRTTHDGGAAVLVVERLQKLESLVKDLSSQLEQAQAAVPTNNSGSPANSTGSSTRREADDRGDTPSTNLSRSATRQSGKLVIQDADRSRYVSSDFWSKINDELSALRMVNTHRPDEDSESSEDDGMTPESQPTDELHRTPLERNAFMFGHNLSSSPYSSSDLHPLPSQVSYLLDVFSDNVNFMAQAVHMPSVSKLARDMRTKGTTSLTPSNEALLFAIYYAAITSMEEDDVSYFAYSLYYWVLPVASAFLIYDQVKSNFGASKSDLNHRFRVGFESAVARADFLNAPNITLVQAFIAFLCLARRHDSPRYVWMMVGIVIRMAQSIGLHRDGFHFSNLSPFEVEVRRRAWWALYMLDLRSSEDQGTDFTIAHDSFDTKIPLNINDTDIEPGMKEAPKARVGVTDTTYTYVSIEYTSTTRKLLSLELKNGIPDLDHLSRLLDEMYEKLDRECFQHVAKIGEIRRELGITVTRLVMAKLKLLIFVPLLLSSPTDYFSVDIRTVLFVSAIEVAEYNHSMNENAALTPYLWIFQTYTHWQSIVYLLIEISRRAWSPLVERAWVALHSKWLIPVNAFKMDKNKEISMPLRKLLAKARRHRIAELERLRKDPSAVRELEEEDKKSSHVPASSGSCPPGVDAVEAFRSLWRQTLAASPDAGSQQKPGSSSTYPTQEDVHARDLAVLAGHMAFPSTLPGMGYGNSVFVATTSQWYPAPPNQGGSTPAGRQPTMPELTRSTTASMAASPSMSSGGQVPPSGFAMNPVPGYDPQAFSPSWLWADMDPYADVFGGLEGSPGDMGIELDHDMNWSDWVQSAKHMERNAGPGN
ncbi:fungal-specific transcription factor domain-containing protein [Apiospora aurea]|uniref:Fungal-specific transcription factor domain-containing protein n=1 Tax=Apiospora aurea TaxID=335848 RepID=A0ABR1QPY8_9PEZI